MYRLPALLYCDRARGYMTLFNWVTTTKRGTYAAITKRVPEQYRPQVGCKLGCLLCQERGGGGVMQQSVC
jgi:hypothetical protein